MTQKRIDMTNKIVEILLAPDCSRRGYSVGEPSRVYDDRVKSIEVMPKTLLYKIVHHDGRTSYINPNFVYEVYVVEEQ